MKVCSRCGNCIECHEPNDAMDCYGTEDDEPTDAYSTMLEFAEESDTCAFGHKEDEFGK